MNTVRIPKFIVIKTRKKGTFFLIVESQQINVKGTMDLENKRLATIIIMIDSGQNHPWMLKPMGKAC